MKLFVSVNFLQHKKIIIIINKLKKEWEKKVFRKEAPANREQLPKHDYVTSEICQALINATEVDIICYRIALSL